MPRMVVMDTETTGLDPNKHDIIQIACICLNPNFTPDKTVQPFYMLIKPSHYPYNGTSKQVEDYTNDIKEAMDINKMSMKKVLDIGFHWIKAAELFEEWWKTLGGQQVEPLCQNYPFDSSMMRKWLGRVHFDFFFSRYYRDTYAATRFIRDRASFFGQKDPFPNGHGLSKVATALGIPVPKAHDALEDCITTALVYKEACTYMGISKDDKDA